MTIRTVRLDPEDEQTLEEIRSATGLPISEALKRGLRTLRDQLRAQTNANPYDVYKQLDLGSGGYAVAPSTRVRQGVRGAIARKLGR